MGHQTTVYEMLPKLGGMLRYGIPNYRLPKDRLEEDVNAILKTGVDVKYGLKIGKDITIDVYKRQPVERVNLTVENTRVGQITDFDKLTLDVYTNGTLQIGRAHV